jgi:hypothetical protein
MHVCYMTDYGPCQVSEMEARLLWLDDQIARRDVGPQVNDLAAARIRDKASAVRAACERFAAFNESVRD